MFEAIHHVGIVVAELEPALATYGGAFGMQVMHREVFPDHGIELAFLETPDGRVELIQALSADSRIGRFLAQHGPGLHHIAYEVADIEAALAELAARNVELIDTTPRTGARATRVAFIHPKGTGGVLSELVQETGA